MLETRLKRLEQSRQANRVTAIIRQCFAPGINGPVSKGTSAVHVLGPDGQSFTRHNYATEATLLEAADSAHRAIHGKPLRDTEQET